jgi:hypothetical protein
MKIKTSEMMPPALDWAVSECEGVTVEYIDDGITALLADVTGWAFDPSNNWAQGGPIIEREEIQICTNGSMSKKWEAVQDNADDVIVEWGPTPLIAAMRCYVASKMGDEIEVPQELSKEKRNEFVPV